MPLCLGGFRVLEGFSHCGAKDKGVSKTVFCGKRHPEVKEDAGISVLKEDFVSADLVDPAIES